jgi:hypothetical protein
LYGKPALKPFKSMEIKWATNVEKAREMINAYKVVRKF